MAFTGINKSTDYFNTVLYTGDASVKSITDLSFTPGLVWIKGGTQDHVWTDQVRGATKYIRSNTTNAEATVSGVTSFNSDGFTLGSANETNESGVNFYGWNWKANGQGSSNTDGTINSTYTSANTTSGFSIITYTGDGNSGATIGHGLGVVPKIVLIKKLNGADAWFMTGENLGWNKYLNLNSSSAESGASNNSFTGTAPTTTVFSVGSDSGVNGNGDTYVAYVFAEKQGFCKIGTYVGNGNTNGPFNYTGFKPAWLLTKKLTGAAESWFLNDNKRSLSGGFNTNYYYILPDASSAQGTSSSLAMDILSNGVKVRNSDTAYNNNNSTYLYIAFAAAPIVGTNDIAANAF